MFLTAPEGLWYPAPGFEEACLGLKNLRSSYFSVSFLVDDGGMLTKLASKLSKSSISFSFCQSSSYSIFSKMAPIGTF